MFSIFFGVFFIFSYVYGCPIDSSFYERIDIDLKPFSDGITRDMIETLKKSPYTCSVVIDNHQVISPCLYHPQMMFFSQIAKDLPNMEFVLNTLDEPRIFKNDCSDSNWENCACDSNFNYTGHGFFVSPATWAPIQKKKLPIFSSGTLPQCFNDILMPSHLHMQASSGYSSNELPWSSKQFKAFWRGSSTGGFFHQSSPHYSNSHRHRLVSACSKLKDCDAHFSGYLQCDASECKAMQDEYGPPNHVPMNQQYNNKIILDVDGNTYSSRFATLLFSSGSAIFKASLFDDIGSSFSKPWIHYVPLKIDMSDLEEKLEWARSNDSQLEQIAINGRNMAKQHLTYEAYKCYMTRLLMSYYDLLIE